MCERGRIINRDLTLRLGAIIVSDWEVVISIVTYVKCVKTLFMSAYALCGSNDRERRTQIAYLMSEL